MRALIRDNLLTAALTAVILPIGCVLTGTFAKIGAKSLAGIFLSLGLWYLLAFVLLLCLIPFREFYRSVRPPEGGPGGRLTYAIWTRALPFTVAGFWLWADQSPGQFGPSGSLPNTFWALAPAEASVYTAIAVVGIVARRSIQRRSAQVLADIRQPDRRWFSLPVRERSTPEQAPAKERINPTEHYSGAAFWSDVSCGVVSAAAYTIAASLLAMAVRGSVAGLVRPRGWGPIVDYALPWSAEKVVQIFLGLWLLQACGRALTEGLRDYEVPRAGIFVFISMPPILVLLAGIWFHQLIGGAITTLVLVIAVGVWSNAPPEDTFSQLRVAKVLAPMLRRWARRSS